ncbi:MAG: hypothetical protein WD072_02215 [Pirellulales bacterium]
MGLFGGLLGWDADDPRLPDSAAAPTAGACAALPAAVLTLGEELGRDEEALPRQERNGRGQRPGLCQHGTGRFGEVIPFDEVAATAKRVAEQMPRELRCTTLGGLSITPTSLAIEARLAARKAAACGSGGCGCG